MPFFNNSASSGVTYQWPAEGLQRIKRKMWEQPAYDTDMVDVENNDYPAKRLCRDVCPDPVGDNGVVIKQMPEMALSFHGCMKDVGGFSKPVQVSALVPQRPVTPPPQEMSVEFEQTKPVSLSPMMMDGETYNHLSPADVEQAISGMESDYCPDPAQYHSELEFCSTKCTGGVRSPVSNSIRCPCTRWDTDDIPYSSDYY